MNNQVGQLLSTHVIDNVQPSGSAGYGSSCDACTGSCSAPAAACDNDSAADNRAAQVAQAVAQRLQGLTSMISSSMPLPVDEQQPSREVILESNAAQSQPDSKFHGVVSACGQRAAVMGALQVDRWADWDLEMDNSISGWRTSP